MVTSDSSVQSDQPGNESEGARRRPTKAVNIPEAITVARLAELVSATPIEVMKHLMRAGIMASINQAIDFETASAITPLYGYRAVPDESVSRKRESSAIEEDVAIMKLRPPVVTVLGHVDHGKTTLLDAIRKTKVADHEAGGITQHIGAYQIEYKDQPITILDTPGHEAFTAMRARGADVTDIAVLVVAADDGIMPQTMEAISHIRAADVPIIVAINKVDLPDADPERVKRQMAEQNLLLEEWGGDVVGVEVSAKTGHGVDDLLENILVVAEIADLKANPDRQANGVVVEAKLDRSRGPVATVLVKGGTLNLGDHVVVGTIRGRVKALVNYAGERIKAATPAMPVEILGLAALPAAGDLFEVVGSDREARAMVEERERQEGAARRVSMEEMFNRIRTGESHELNLILKADVQGSVEAVRGGVLRLSTDKAQVNIIHSGSGAISESDIFLAVAAQAIVIGFNTGIDIGARRVAVAEGVETRLYNVIYNLLEDVTNVLEGLVEPEMQDVVEGHATVRAVFKRGRQGNIAGVYVTDGRLLRTAMARVLRNGELLYDGPISSLRRFKDDAREVATGYECGIAVTGFDEFEEEDVIEVHRLDQVRA